MRVVLDVLDGITNNGPLATIEIPNASVRPPVQFRCRPEVALLVSSIRKEAIRLREAILQQQSFLKDHILPLKNIGWRIYKDREDWVVDAGFNPLINPVHPKALAEIAAVIDKNSGVSIAKESDLMILMINGVPLPIPKILDEREIPLFKAQISQISKMIFSALLRTVRKRPDLLVISSSFLDFVIQRPGCEDLRICLEPFGVNRRETSPGVVERLISGFLKKAEPDELLKILLSFKTE